MIDASLSALVRLQSRVMADTLSLSLWYPNLRQADLADKLAAVLGCFASHGGDALVYSATVWPVSWHEAPIFQRLWGRVAPDPEHPEQPRGVMPRQAVAESLELLHEDYAYEFQIAWNLWEIEESPEGGELRWARTPRLARVIGYGPLFDEGAYEAEGHIRIDLGADEAFLEEDANLSTVGSRHIEENIRQLISLAAAVEKASGANARLLWSESGESLAERLAARLGVRN